MNRVLLTLTGLFSAVALLAQTTAPAPSAPAPVPAVPNIPAPALEPAPTAPTPTEPAAPNALAEAPKKPAKKKAPPSSLPFRGKVETTDAKAMTVTLAGKEKQRVFNVTSKTRFEKDGKPATFGDVKAGEDIRGSYAKSKDGENLVRLVLGAPVPAEKKAPASKMKAEAKAPATPPVVNP
jgi:hypothetical protein